MRKPKPMTCSSVVMLEDTMQKAQAIKLGLFAFEFYKPISFTQHTTHRKLIRRQSLNTFILIKFSDCVKEIFWNLPHAAIISL
jgi:hypothetical protein